MLDEEAFKTASYSGLFFDRHEEGRHVIIDHNNLRYQRIRENAGANMYNGAYYYSREIVKNIIPKVKTDRNWITVNVEGAGCSHAIVFIHNNLQPERYEWLYQYGFTDLILVCGLERTCEMVKHLGTPIYLPLSIDLEYMKKFMGIEKTKDTAYAGRKSKTNMGRLPDGIDYLCGMKRAQLLKHMAEYKNIYCVGRTAIEAKVLGCRVLPYDERFPDPDIWRIVDNSIAAEILQQQLDIIDR